MLSWFTKEVETGLSVCRIKNNFAAAVSAVGGKDTYCDLKIFVVVTGKSGLRLICEIQIHDVELYLLKLKVSRKKGVRENDQLGSLFQIILKTIKHCCLHALELLRFNSHNVNFHLCSNTANWTPNGRCIGYIGSSEQISWKISNIHVCYQKKG